MGFDTFEQILARRLKRRDFVKGAVGALLLLPVRSDSAALDQLSFWPIAPNSQDTVTIPPGYAFSVLLRWGDPILPGAPAFNIGSQSPESQSKQFGFNCDFVGFFPFNGGPISSRSAPTGPRDSNWGVLAVNHEYTDEVMMFPTYNAAAPTRIEVDVALAAHGVSIVEVWNNWTNGWKFNPSSPLNRRITGETEIEITGPAAGDDWMKTGYDPEGKTVRGTLNNCGGGKTPWGTLLTAEENFNQYFANNGSLPSTDSRKSIHTRYGLNNGAGERQWERYHDRFDVAKEPNEAFRFGWLVEIDPYDPTSVPKKRTALGRTKHEAATTAVAPDGRVVVYSGDDERFAYMYKFITNGKFDARNRSANMNLLDSGTLYVARFRDDGTGDWLPMVGGQGGVLSTWTQAQVCINTRGAGDALGATKMDRPEDVEINPVNGKVYALFTNNTSRGAAGQPAADRANPRSNNRHGHVIELTEGGNNPASLTFQWSIFLLAGNPAVSSDGTYYAGFDTSRVSAISCPDNLVFDSRGNLWIATDGQPGTIRVNDGIFAVPVDGPDRGFLRQFMSAPVAAEVCGPEFTPDNTTLFCAIQHPGEGGTLARMTSNWPDGSGAPPRASVIAIYKSTPGPKTIGL
jgi:secreted PhoX family phosphatase